MMTPTQPDTSVGHGQDETGLELSPQLNLSVANDIIFRILNSALEINKSELDKMSTSS